MIFGKAEVRVTETGSRELETNNDTYALTPNMTFSVLRPFRVSGIGIAVLLSAFGIAFTDLLKLGELWIISGCATLFFVAGNSLAQLVLTNRELRGTDLSTAVWGTYRHLNRVRRQIAQANNRPTQNNQEDNI